MRIHAALLRAEKSLRQTGKTDAAKYSEVWPGEAGSSALRGFERKTTPENFSLFERNMLMVILRRLSGEPPDYIM